MYVGTWTGWIVTKGGYYRNWAESTHLEWKGALAWVPLWFQNLWHYQTEMYNYSINLHVSHPYQSNPLTWLFMIRPTSMYYVGSNAGQNGCTANACSAAITSLGNPLIWWAAAAAVFYLVYRLARYRDWRIGLILTGLAAGYLPWMLYIDRTIFQFYAIAFEPYLILALAARDRAHPRAADRPRAAPPPRHRVGVGVPRPRRRGHRLLLAALDGAAGAVLVLADPHVAAELGLNSRSGRLVRRRRAVVDRAV